MSAISLRTYRHLLRVPSPARAASASCAASRDAEHATPLGREVPTGAQDDRRRPDGAVRRVSLLAAALRRFTRAGGSRHQFCALFSEVVTRCDLNSPLPVSPPSSCTTEYPCCQGPRIEGRARPPRVVNPYIQAPASTCTYDGRTSRPIPTSPPVSVRTDREVTVPARGSDGRARRTRRSANP